MALPHIKNSTAARDRWDPVHKSMFEVVFTLPAALKTDFPDLEALMTEHVMNISGLNALYKTAGTDSQKFMGVDRTYIKPTVDSTKAEIEIEFTLNLRNGTDNYILKVFRAWAALGYDIATGKRSLKKDYCADWLKVSVANREGDIYQEVVFRDVMLNGDLDFDGGLDYTAGDALTLKVKLVSDWWEEKVA
jgi:hypothetical protein